MKTNATRKQVSARRSSEFRRRMLPVLVAACFSGNAVANPLGAQVVNGQASIAAQGNVLSVTNTPGTIINWQGFSINQGEITRFIQQNANSAVLNRITGQDPSHILGTLQSNGRVFLINPNGILFGQGARVDVNGFVASTLNITNEDFLNGRMFFNAGDRAGIIRNQGAITTPSGGKVYLIAPNVENSGIITAPRGEVLLAAGRSVQLVDSMNPDLHVVVSAPDDETLNLGHVIAQGGRTGIYGALVRQRGIVNANSAVVGEDGKVVLKASKDVLLENGSITTATGAGRGGDIHVLGERAGLTGNAKVDASGQNGGGTILVGGDYQGANAQIRNASRTFVGSDSELKADAIERGDGGKVIVWADDMARVRGRISARGGQQGGNGGFVETSGKQDLDFRAKVDVGAAAGAGGTLLLDPASIVITAGSGDGDGNTSTTDFSGSALGTVNFADAGPTVIYQSELTGLAPGTNIVLEATDAISTTGDFGSLITLPTNANLTMRTRNATTDGTGTIGIDLTGSINGTGLEFKTQGTGSITLQSGTDANPQAANIAVGKLTTGGGAVTLSGSGSLAIGGSIVTSGGNVSLTAPTINLQSGQQINVTGGSGTEVRLKANEVTLGGTIDAGGPTGTGNVFIDPRDTTRPIDLGTKTAGMLGVTSAELNGISAANLKFGTANGTGNITVSAPINLANSAIRSFSFETGGNISIDNVVTVNAANGFLSAGILNGTGDISVGSLGGLATTGTGSQIFMKANNMTLGGAGGAINAGTGNVFLLPTTGAAIALGQAAADVADTTLGLSENELKTVTTSGKLTLGGFTATGGVSVDGALNLTSANGGGLSGELAIESGSTITQAGVITADKLAISALGNVTLSAPNSVGTLAATTTGAFSFNNSGALTIGSVSGVNGVRSTVGGDVTLQSTGGPLTVVNSSAADDIYTNSGLVTLQSAGSLFTASGSSISGGKVTISTTSGGDISLSGNVAGTQTGLAAGVSAIQIGIGTATTHTVATSGSLTAASGSIDITGQGGSVTLNGPVTQLDVNGAVKIASQNPTGGGGTISGAGLITSNNIDLQSVAGITGSRVVGSLNTAAIDTSGTTFKVGNTTPGEVTVLVINHAGKAVFPDGAFFVGGNPTVNIQATGDLSVPAIGTGASNLTLKSTSGSLTTTGALAGYDINLSAAGNFSFAAGASAVNDLFIDLTGAGSTLSLPASLTFGGGARTIIKADKMNFSAGGLNVGGGGTQVSLLPKTSARVITLGTDTTDANNDLELSATDLSRINAGMLSIGDTTSGALNVDAAIAPSTVSTLVLNSGSTIGQSGPITVTNLGIRALDSVSLTDASNNVANLVASIGDGSNQNKNFSFRNGANPLNIGSGIASMSGIGISLDMSGYSTTTPDGVIALTSGGVLTQSGGGLLAGKAVYAEGTKVLLTQSNPTGVIAGKATGTATGDMFSYNSSNGISVTTVNGTSGISTVNNKPVSISGAGNVDLAEQIDAGTAAITIDATGTGSINGGGLVKGGSLTANAVGGIGNATALTTAVAMLDVTNTGTGDIAITNSGALTVQGARQTGAGVNGISIVSYGDMTVGAASTGAGPMSLRAFHKMNVTGTVSTSAGSVLLEAVGTETPGNGDTLTIGAAGVVSSSSGAITLIAGDDIVIANPASVTSTSGTVTMSPNQNGTVAPPPPPPPPPPPTVAECTANPNLSGCSSVLPTLDSCTANPSQAGCSVVLPTLATCTANPTQAGCTAVLPTLDSCTTNPTQAGCTAVLPTLDACTANPTQAGCAVVLPSLSTCTSNPTMPGCSVVLPSLASCTANPALAGCAAVLPSLTSCTTNPSLAGCSAVLPSLDSCAANPTQAGCSVVLPSLAACTISPTLAGCIAVLPSLSSCAATPTQAGCTAVLPSLSSCTVNPTQTGCTAVLPSVDQCNAAPTTPGCSVVATLHSCTANPLLAGCTSVLPSLATCTTNPTQAGCSVVLPSMTTCIASPTQAGCIAVLPTLGSCTTNPAQTGCTAVLPSLDACTVNPAQAGCSAVLPTLSSCTTNPAQPGCSVVLPTLVSCMANQSQPGCTAVLPTVAQCTADRTIPGCSTVVDTTSRCIREPALPECQPPAPPNVPTSPTVVAPISQSNPVVVTENSVIQLTSTSAPIVLSGRNGQPSGSSSSSSSATTSSNPGPSTSSTASSSPASSTSPGASGSVNSQEETSDGKKDGKKTSAGPDDSGVQKNDPAKKMYCN